MNLVNVIPYMLECQDFPCMDFLTCIMYICIHVIRDNSEIASLEII